METILINVDSRVRDKALYPEANYFKTELDINFKNIDFIKISSSEIPNHFFVFSSNRKNNFFRINDILITIPDNNYTIIQLINELNNQINLTIGPNTFSFNLENNKVNFNSINPGLFVITFDNQNYIYPSLGNYLGFNKKTYSAINFIKATSFYDVDGEQYLFLRINNFGNLNIQPQIPKKALTKIILKSKKNEINYDYDNDTTKTFIFKQPQNISNLEIELLDAYGNRLENNIDYSFTIEVGQIYKYDSYLDKLNYLNISK